MGRKCSTFYNKLSKVLSGKWDTPQSIVGNWIHTKISFASLKLCLLCLRGSRSLNQNNSAIGDNINLSGEISRIRKTGNTFIVLRS